MDFSTWVSFVFIVSALFLVPGPTVLMVIGLTMKFGRSGVPYLLFGINLADLCFIALGLGGMALLVEMFPLALPLFRSFSLIYVCYLVYSLWRSDNLSIQRPENIKGPDKSGFALTQHAYFTTITNPKGVVFVLGVFPSYIPEGGGLDLSISLILTLTFVTLSILVAGSWGLLASTALSRFKDWPHVGKLSATMVFASVAWVWLGYLIK